MSLLPRRLPRKFNRSTSNVARKYTEKKRPSKHRRRWVKLKRSYKRWQRLWARSRVYIVRGALFLLLCTLAIVFILLIFSPILNVRTIAIARTSSRLDQEEVQTMLAPLFNEHLFFVTAAEVERLLVAERSDIQNVTINKVYPSELRVIIELQPVIAALQIIESDAGDSAITQSGSLRHDYITAEGLYVQTLLPSGSGDALPALTIVDWSVKPQPNQLLLPPQLLEDVFVAEQLLAQQFGQQVTKRTVYVRAQEYHLQIGDRTLWFDVRSSLQQQIERYRIFLQAQINFPVEQYIDLRLHDRVIWK